MGRRVLPFVCVSALVVCGCGMYSTADQSASAGGLEVSPLEFDAPLSSYYQDQEGMRSKAEFSLRNLGRGQLTIDVHENCGCLAVSEKTMELSPGERRTLAIETRPPLVGDRRVKVSLLTNDPTRPVVDVFIVTHGTARPPFLLPGTVRRVSFSNVFAPGATRLLSFQALEKRSDDPWVGAPLCTSSYLTLSQLRVGEQPAEFSGDPAYVKRLYSCDITLSALPPVGHTLDHVVFPDRQTGAETLMTFEIVVERVNEYYAVPGSIFLRGVADDAKLAQKLFVMSAETRKPVSISDASSDAEWLEVRVVPAGSATWDVVQLSVQDGPSSGFAQASVQIHPGASNARVISVPVLYRRASSGNE